MAIGDFLFKEKEDKYIKRIEELEKSIEDLKKLLRAKDEQISYLGLKIEEAKENLEKEKTKFSPKQLELIERNLKKSAEDAKNFKSILNAYKIDSDKNISTYRIDLKKFYSEKKMEEIVNLLMQQGLNFIDELNEVKLHYLPEETKNLDEAKKRFLDFKEGKYSWDILTAIRKGEKISKIYSKSKKLLTFFSNLNLEFMDDIENFEFSKLKEQGFKANQIDDFRNKRNEYYKVYKVSE